MKKVICLVLVLIMALGCVPVLAQSETADFAYIVESGKAYVTSYMGNDSEVVIPSEIDGYTVAGIGEAAFANRDDITKVTIPDTVTYLGRRAFFKCTSLEEIVIPASVSSLYENTFVECRKLKKVVLSEGVADIEAEAFLDCRIETLVVMSENTKFQSQERVEFYSKGALKWYYVFPSFYRTYIVEMFAPSGSLAEKYATENDIAFKPIEEYDAIGNFILEETEDTVVIKGYKDPATTELYVPAEINGKKVVLGEGAFEWTLNPDNHSLEKVTIAEGITSLPRECLYFSSVKEVNLPESLTEIGERAFSNSDITAIDIKNVTTIAEAAFDSCESLTTVTHSGKLENIGRDAFNGCSKLRYIDLTTVKTLGVRAFSGCSRLESVKLQNLESWEGINDSQIDNDGRCHIKQMKHSHGGQSYYIGLNAYVYAPFFACNGLTDVTVRYPDAKADEKFPALFLNCNNINSFTIENYQDAVSQWECAHLSFDNTTGDIYFNKRPHDMTVFCSNIEAEAYAKNNGWEFVLSDDGRVEVEPTVQGIHGGIIAREYFTERITKIAESLGGTVLVSGNNIAVQKNGKSIAIAGDTVYYMENGKIVSENLYHNTEWIKMPEKALESVLGADSRKSEEYKKAINGYSSEIYRIVGTIETPYGSVVEIYAGYDVMHGFTNVLNFVKWDGEVINITEAAPYKNPWSPAEWEKIELSHDGKVLTITYPENKKKTEYYYTYNSPKKVLWDEGTYVITANLETGDVKCVIKPLKKEAVEEEKTTEKPPVIDWVEPVKTIDKDGMKVSVSILSEPQNGPDNMFDGNYVSYCVLYVKDEASPEYMEFDLDEIKTVKQLALAFRDATIRTTYFDVRVSEDGVNFETVIEKRGSNGDTNELQYFDINKNARYIRVYGYSNTYNKKWVSITEARVIAD